MIFKILNDFIMISIMLYNTFNVFIMGFPGFPGLFNDFFSDFLRKECFPDQASSVLPAQAPAPTGEAR